MTQPHVQQHIPRQEDAVAALRARPGADVLIIGGGINGIATFRELALQGVDVALVERDDYVSGASAASSHMVHGGIRYLENGEFRLVKEAVQERNRLIQNAPHYVRPLETTIPVFSTFSGLLAAPFRLLITHGRGKPRERGALLIKLGLTIYDTFSRHGGRVPRHRFRGRRRSLRALPRLNRNIRYTATYFDASMHDPERLALDVLLDGITAGTGAAGTAGTAASSTARAANRTAAIGATDGAVLLRDEVSGETFPFRARVIVNTSGPWTDLTNAALGSPTTYMGGTKGSHIVLDHPELLAATGGREIFFEHADGRIVLIYPLKGRVMVGTTDIEADPSATSICTDAEVDYFIDLIRHVFPTISVRPEHIVYTFSGIRPLPHHDDTLPGFVSRDYRIEPGRLSAAENTTAVLSLIGGKWTTFRALAEHLANETLQLLGVPRQVFTRATPIGGAVGFPTGPAARKLWISRYSNGVDHTDVSRLLDRYGTRAADLLATLEAPSLTPLTERPEYFREELAFLAQTESVCHLDDVILRRTSLGFTGRLTRAALAEVAAVIGGPLEWDAARQQEEITRTERILRSAHRISLDEPGLQPMQTSERTDGRIPSEPIR